MPWTQLYRETDGDAWVWVAFAPVWPVGLAFGIGQRTQESATLLLDRVVYVTDEQIPFFTSDQFAESREALWPAYGTWASPPRKGHRGRSPAPRRVPLPGLLYAQVVKKRENGRGVAGQSQTVFGTADQLEACLAASPRSHTVNPSFVERETLPMRQRNRCLTRRSKGFSKELPWFEKPLGLSLTYSHWGLPH